jgi:hypothetical protein
MKFENISTKKNIIIQELICCASDSSMRSKHGACLVRNNKILCMQKNMYGKDLKSFSHHAEVMIGRRFNTLKLKDYKFNYELWVIRYSKQLESCIESKPCYNCIRYIKRKMPYVNSIVYSSKNGKFIRENISQIENKHLSLGHRSLRGRDR